MSGDFNLDLLGLLVAFVWPGLLAMQAYQLVIPTRNFEWKDAVVRGLFYSVINYIVFFPAAVFVLRPTNLEDHPWTYWFVLLLLLLIGPLLLVVLYIKALRWKWIARRLQAPFPTSWDYFFGGRTTCFMLIRLKDGAQIGGYWGPESYASAYPNEGDLYVSNAYRVDARGCFVEPIEGSRGILIRRDEYRYIELFGVPADNKGDTDDGQVEPGSEGGGDTKRNEGAAVDGCGPVEERGIPTAAGGVLAGRGE